MYINLICHANILAFTPFISSLTQLSLFYSLNSLSLCRLNNFPNPSCSLCLPSKAGTRRSTFCAEWHCWEHWKIVHALLSNDVKIYSKRADNISAQRGLWEAWLWQRRIHEIKQPPQNLHSQNKHLLSAFSVLNMILTPRVQQWKEKNIWREMISAFLERFYTQLSLLIGPSLQPLP